MTVIDPDVRALRDVLIPAVERDVARARPRVSRRLAVPLVVGGTLLSGTGLAAATGIIFADPKPDPAVPAAAEWQFFTHDPMRPEPTGPPVIMRPKPEALARTNRALEAALLERGVLARCGEDKAHPLACYLPNGELVAGDDAAAAYASLEGADVLESSADHYEIRRLSEAEAHRWLCEHPESRPSQPPPTGC